LVPECLQDDCNGAALAKAAQSWLDDPVGRQSLQASYVEIHESLRADTAKITLDVLTTLSAALGR
jgi:lipid-A-disaccharide synthase